MPGSGNGENVTPISYKSMSENDVATSPILTSTPQKNGKKINPPSPEEAKKTISDALSPILPTNQALQNDESDYIDMSSPERESSNELGESLYAELNLPTADGSVHGELESVTYTTIKKNSDNEINGQHPTLNRSGSQETVFDEPWDREKSEKDLLERLSQHSETHSSLPPSYKTDDSKKSFLSDSESDTENDEIRQSKKANRVLPKAKYAMQQESVVIFGITAIALGTSAALVYLQDKAKFIAFFTNSPLYTTVPVIAIASLLAISPIFCAIKQFRNTEEHHIQKKGANEILDNVLGYQPKDKVIKSVRLKYSNGTHSNFILNAWESKDDFINIDKKVINKTNKIESIINNRPLFTTLLTSVVAANIAFPLLLYAEGGVNNIQKFYQNPLANNIGLSFLIGSGILALSIVCLGIHYYRKTNCTNLIYSEEKIDPKNVNGKFIEEIKRERTNVLEENHSQDAKRSSLTLEQVVVQSHNYKDVIYGVGG